MQKTMRDGGVGSKALSVLTALVLVIGLMPAWCHETALAENSDGAAFNGEVAPDPADYFTATVDGVQATAITYEPEAYSYCDYMAGATAKVGVFTVVVPSGTEEVELAFPANRIVYNYDADGKYLAGYYEDYGVTGEMSSTVKVDSNADGILDYIQIQTPYDATTWSSTLLCAVTFKYADGAEGAGQLTENLLAQFEKDGKYGEVSASSFSYAFYGILAVSAVGKSSEIDADALMAAFDEDAADEYFSAGRMAKYILALGAAGIDCTSYKGRDLVSEMEAKMVGSDGAFVDPGLYDDVFVLAVYQRFAGSADLEAAVKAAVLASQDETGLLAGAWGADCQTTAQGLMALASYDDEATQAVVAKAVAALKANQNADGGFTYSPAYPSGSDVDTTGNVVAALVAAGEDVGGAFWLTVEGKSPVSYLVDKADTTLDGYSDAYSPEMAAGDALVGLVCAELGEGIFAVDYPELNPVAEDEPETVAVYRMYNPATSEHLWTTDVNEYAKLQSEGWNPEGATWDTPVSGKGVYRLYNGGLGVHHYTADEREIEILINKEGWAVDHKSKPMFYASATNEGTPVYRLYNEGLSQHHLTTSQHEIEVLVDDYGWKVEGIAFCL